MRVISVRENPEYEKKAIKYFQENWKSVLHKIYEDCIKNCIKAKKPLSQWYLLEKNDTIIGCAGLITNDFISRMDLYPWVCALFIDEKFRGNNYGSLLLEKAKIDSQKAGFDSLYLCTDHTDYYERFGYKYIGQGYHPWNEESRIYELKIE